MKCNFRWSYFSVAFLLIGIFFIGFAFPVPVFGSEGDEESRFYARQYMSETQALSYQTESDSDRVVEKTLKLTQKEIRRVRKQQRVKMYTDTYRVYQLFRDGEDTPYRYALPIQETGQHEFMDLLYGVNRDGTVHRIDLLVYREPYGAEIESRRFMRQFEDRSLKDSKFRVNLDVVHIAGATISAQSVARGTRRVLEILRIKDMIP